MMKRRSFMKVLTAIPALFALNANALPAHKVQKYVVDVPPQRKGRHLQKYVVLLKQTYPSSGGPEWQIDVDGMKAEAIRQMHEFAVKAGRIPRDVSVFVLPFDYHRMAYANANSIHGYVGVDWNM